MLNKKITSGFIFFISLFVFVSCSKDEEFLVDSTDLELEKTYESMRSIQTISFFSLFNSNSVHGAKEAYYPVFTTQDLKYLSSLSQEDFEEVYETFLSKLGTDSLKEVESTQDSNYQKIFNILGGHEEMDQFITFGQEYIISSQGWNEVKRLLPKNISLEQGKIYIYMATYIDKIGRPIYSILNTTDIPVSRGDSYLCKMYLTERLAIAGVGISAEAFLDAMTGGAATPLEVFATGVDLIDIWYDYEVCNNRWH